MRLDKHGVARLDAGAGARLAAFLREVRVYEEGMRQVRPEDGERYLRALPAALRSAVGVSVSAHIHDGEAS